MRKILKYVFIVISSILIFILGGFAINAATEQIIIGAKISSFKDKGVYQESISDNLVKYYKVSMDGEAPGYTMSGNVMLPGNFCDIVTTKSTFMMNEFFSAFKNFNAGGHSSIVTGNYADSKIRMTKVDSVEATGTEVGENVATISTRYYWNQEYTDVTCFRANLSEEQKDEIMSVSGGHLGDPYNYNFTFDTLNKSYCSDLVSKIYDKVGINLNKDGFWTTVWDIMVSPDLYITYHHYIEDGVKYVYYVG